MSKEIKAILDFDGTLTDEIKQAEGYEEAGKAMLAGEILDIDREEMDQLFKQTKERILLSPQLYIWQVNGLPACYAYEGAYLLNTVTFQQILYGNEHFLGKISTLFPADNLDSVTKCVNYLFHTGSLDVHPHFLDGTRELLIELLEHGLIEPVILTNSETRKINKNLSELRIGEKGEEHDYRHEIEILGDTRQYVLDANWEQHFEDPTHGSIQVLPIDPLFSVDLRRPIYHRALQQVTEKGHREIVVAADGFSLAGALPLMMGLRFFLLKTDYTPDWCEKYVQGHPKGRVVGDLAELKEAILSLV